MHTHIHTWLMQQYTVIQMLLTYCRWKLTCIYIFYICGLFSRVKLFTKRNDCISWIKTFKGSEVNSVHKAVHKSTAVNPKHRCILSQLVSNVFGLLYHLNNISDTCLRILRVNFVHINFTVFVLFFSLCLLIYIFRKQSVFACLQVHIFKPCMCLVRLHETAEEASSPTQRQGGRER